MNTHLWFGPSYPIETLITQMLCKFVRCNRAPDSQSKFLALRNQHVEDLD